MKLLNEWLNLNVLTLNPNKTCYMTFGRAIDTLDFNISSDGTETKRARTYKYLGLVLDEDVKFGEHVDHDKKQIKHSYL